MLLSFCRADAKQGEKQTSSKTKLVENVKTSKQIKGNKPVNSPKTAKKLKDLEKQIAQLQEERQKQLDIHSEELEKEGRRKDNQATLPINWDLVGDVYELVEDSWQTDNQPVIGVEF